MYSQPSTSSFSSTSYPPPPPIPAPALYCEPETRDFGQRSFGQRGFGGLLEDWHNPKPDGTTRWIPQYNLQSFWRRHIPPNASSLIEPLIPPRMRRADDFDRMPGHFSYRSNEYELYNRNLLATRFFESNNDESCGVLKIWTVNERSKRKFIECFSVELDENCIPIPETVENLRDFKTKMMPPQKHESRPPKAKEPLLELRTSEWSSNSFTRLFLRSPTLLRMVHFQEKEMEEDNEDEPMIFRKHIPIFNTAVKCFAESHLIEGTLAVVDYGGRTWIHDITSDSPEKANKLEANDQEIYQRATFCDHPQMVAVAGNYHMETVDMRCSGGGFRACTELWRSPVYETRGVREALYLQGIPPPSAVIRHISRVPTTANMYLVMTDATLHLIDDRFPGKHVFGLKHPYSTGTHKMIVSEKVNDSIGNGSTYSIFCLDQLQVLDSSIFLTKIYNHPSGIWSSVSPFYSIGEPADFNRIIRCGKYADPPIISEPTRALSLVEHQKLNHSLLLRQSDDGTIWYQRFSNDASKSDKDKANDESESFERIVKIRNSYESVWKREEHRPVYSDGMGEAYKETPEDLR
ncbi:hypothetical protein CAEBREN_13783 [Caenorhabditis brenneri]|uniref:Uncharacterized protein n=1 Tax=Caenorhabditis brenneri TaxID=135651 RepID=G0PGQ6_CAEBE|nr:hypothetical protein CAEBREN_13783 [Caenorhabditis brenneri]